MKVQCLNVETVKTRERIGPRSASERAVAARAATRVKKNENHPLNIICIFFDLLYFIHKPTLTSVINATHFSVTNYFMTAHSGERAS